MWSRRFIGDQVKAHSRWAAVLVCVLACASIWTYTVDDAYIAFRYARNVVEGHGPVFNPGDRVEGFTSPLWLAAATLCEFLRVPTDHACKAISLAVAAGLFAYLARRTRGLNPASQLMLLLLATHAPLIAGIVCGLETAVNAVLIACLLLSGHDPTEGDGRTNSRRKRVHAWLGPAVWGGLAILCRPENGLLVGVHGLYQWSVRPGQRRMLVAVAASWLAVAATLTAARFLYYGSLMPNTAVAKLGVDPGSLGSAMHYCTHWLDRYQWLPLLGIPALLAKKSRRLAVNGWLLIAAQTGFVFLAGGDWMPGWRFLLPVSVVLAVLGCHSIDAVVAFGKQFSLHRSGTAEPDNIAVGSLAQIACICGVLLIVVTQLWHFRPERWRIDLFDRQLAALETGPVAYLAARTDRDDLIAARDVGVLSYSTRSRILDLVGLTDRHIASTSGLRRRGRIDLDYVFNRRPTYVMLQSERNDNGEMALGRLSRRLAQDDRFGRYRLCRRWELPGTHFCEVHERLSDARLAKTAIIPAQD